jgi:hypothetical protein
VRFLRVLLPRDAPPPRELEERDSPARLRSLLRPEPDARPRALEAFFACEARPRSDLFAAVREPPLPERELRDELLPEEPLREERDPLVAVDLRDDEPLLREEDFLPCERLPLLARFLSRELPERPELFPSACWAVSRLTILLKLLRWPPAVVSW